MISRVKSTTDCVVFADVENMSLPGLARAIAMKSEGYGSSVEMRAYATWSRYGPQRAEYVQAGFEAIETIRCHGQHKNFVDMQLTTDAVEYALLNPDVATFVIASGDADFVPLVRKLKQFKRQVVCVTLEVGARQLKSEANSFEIVGRANEADVLMHTCIKDIVRIAVEVSAHTSPIYLARLGAIMKARLPGFCPRREFGLNWKSLLLLLQAHHLCEVQTIESTGAHLVQFTLSP